jgi:hypothetical protein
MPASDPQAVVYEFFHPFAHLPGRYEWCTIHSPTHGSFDCFIIIHVGTHRPVTVYVNHPRGACFMRDRYPESRCVLVAESDLTVTSQERGRVVGVRLRAVGGQGSGAPDPRRPGTANAGSVREVDLLLSADRDAVPEQAPYGGAAFPVWGGRFSCEGVDLNLAAGATGFVVLQDGGREDFAPPAGGIVTVGSYGRIAPLCPP